MNTMNTLVSPQNTGFINDIIMLDDFEPNRHEHHEYFLVKLFISHFSLSRKGFYTTSVHGIHGLNDFNKLQNQGVHIFPLEETGEEVARQRWNE